MKIVFLVSGSGGNLKFFHLANRELFNRKVELAVIADRPCGAVEFAQREQLEHKVIDYSRDKPGALDPLLHAHKAEIVVTNWNKIIDADTVARHEDSLVNLHYSLLPAFAGLTGVEPVRRAYAQGCRFIGPTCHAVVEDVDAGPILSQAVFSTDRDIDEAIGLMFRLGCLCLLNGIETKSSVQLLQGGGERFDEIRPRPGFTQDCFDKAFWEEVRQA